MNWHLPSNSATPEQQDSKDAYFTPENVRLSTSQALLRYMLSHFYAEEDNLHPIFWGFCNFAGHEKIADDIRTYKNSLSILPDLDEKTLTDCCLSFSEAKKRKQMLILSTSLFPNIYKFLPLLHLANNKHLPLLLIVSYQENFRETCSPKVIQQIESSLQSLQSLSNHTALLSSPEELKPSVDACVDHLMRDPGPVCLLVAQNKLHEFYDYSFKDFNKKRHQLALPSVNNAEVEDLLTSIKKAKKPICILGGGATSSCYHKLSSLMKKLQIPMCETTSGKGSLSFDFPLHLGSLVSSAPCISRNLITESDCIICLGTFLEDYNYEKLFYQKNAKIYFVNLFTQADETKKDPRFTYLKCHLDTLSDQVKNYELEKTIDRGNYIRRMQMYIDEGKKDYIRATFNSGEVATIPQVTACINRSVKAKDIVIYSSEDSSEDSYLFWRCSHHHSYSLIQDSNMGGAQLHKGLGYKLAHPKQALYLILTANDLPNIQNILLAYQSLDLSFNLIILDHPSKKGKQAPYTHHLNDYLKSLGLNTQNCKNLEELETLIKLKRKQQLPLAAVIKTQIYKRNPNLNLWKSSIEQRLGLSESKSVSYKSEEQTWHVRFPWEDKKKEDPIEDLSHSLD